jgi:hypothetical protein
MCRHRQQFQSDEQHQAIEQPINFCTFIINNSGQTNHGIPPQRQALDVSCNKIYSMGLSSNSLIHFTQNKEALIGILEDNFRIHYCLENVITPSGNLHYAIPMVSFCDIPMSEIKDHITKYGAYGIGLRREWGQKMKLNPVLYIDTNSTLGDSMYLAFRALTTGKKVTEVDGVEAQVTDVMRYMKNYEADLIRDSQTISNYKFADEKEWRYVPSKEEAQMLVKGAVMTPERKKEFNDKIKNLRLEFEPSDIKYIIINDESEISEFIDILRKSKGKKYTLQDVERLLTRITTTEQILTDF